MILVTLLSEVLSQGKIVPHRHRTVLAVVFPVARSTTLGRLLVATMVFIRVDHVDDEGHRCLLYHVKPMAHLFSRVTQTEDCIVTWSWLIFKISCENIQEAIQDDPVALSEWPVLVEPHQPRRQRCCLAVRTGEAPALVLARPLSQLDGDQDPVGQCHVRNEAWWWYNSPFELIRELLTE